VNALLALTDPLLEHGLDTTVVLIVIGKTIAVFVLLLLSVLLYIWFLRKVISRSRTPPTAASSASRRTWRCSRRSSRSASSPSAEW
jgi:Na+-transporting methylmalonyl-CoA/oxaloacetate decarboxylase gamma subunit